MKNAVALSVGGQVFISQHIGDLETEPANQAFRRVIADLEGLYDARPQAVAADLHPDYPSRKFAGEACEARVESVPQPETKPRPSAEWPPGPPPRLLGVQHHMAHVLSCMGENGVAPPALGVAWDGTGYGPDGTIWGGEFFLVTDQTIDRVAHLRPFRLPGGEQAIREPRRAALGLLYEQFGAAVFERKDLQPVAAFSAAELGVLSSMLDKKLNSPVTTSGGRLFDAVAALTNLRQRNRFEGQAAMDLEFALDGIDTDESYELSPGTGRSSRILDWSPLLEAILEDLDRGLPAGIVSAKFHNALAGAMVAMARRSGQERVVLSGGCFQNCYLTARVVRGLQSEGFLPCWHQRVPPNDGGIALGQVIAAWRLKV